MRKFRLLSFLNNLSVSQKMLLIFIGCVILPITIQNTFYYNDTEENIQTSMMQHLTLSLSEKANKVSETINGVINLSNRYNTNEELYKLLDSNYSTDINFLVVYQDNIEQTIFSDLAFNRQVRRMVLYSDNPTILNGALVKKIIPWDNRTLGETLLDQNYINLSHTDYGPFLRVSLIPTKTQSMYDRSFSVIRTLTYYPQYYHYNKAIRLDIDTSYLSSMLEETDLFSNIILTDSDNRIIASANTYKEFGSYDIFHEDKVQEGMVVLKQPLADMSLTLYGLYDSNMIAQEFSKMRWKTTRVALFNMLLAVFFIFLVAGNITKRIRSVVKQSMQIAQGNFIQTAHHSMGKDEIGILAESMNHMSEQLKTLIDEKYKSQLVKAQLERETAQAKLLALQSQVNPHFMFNALECIRLKAVVKNETETAQMIKYMSRMFRHIINWDDDIICLKDDMKFLDEFLRIQKYRFDDEFEYKIEVEAAAEESLLPKLIIQPLVENACVHGVEGISHLRFVRVTARVLSERLIITVSDNGSGISDQRLDALNQMLKEGKKISESVGLYNVHQRLALFYGDEFTFDIRSRLGVGTEICVTIPLRFKKEDFSVLNTTH